MTAYIIDTETTGLIDPIEVVSFAAAEFSLLHDSLFIGTVHEQFFKPSKAIEWGAMATHNILPEDLESFPVGGVMKFPGPHAAEYIIGHNVDYDWKALGSPSVRRICTQAMARHVWPTLDSHKLGALIYYTQGATAATRELLKGAHGAATDVRLCALLLPILIKEFECTSVEALWQSSEFARIPTVMAFGKFKGQPVANVDRGWISWYRRQEDTDSYLLEAFRKLGR